MGKSLAYIWARRMAMVFRGYASEREWRNLGRKSKQGFRFVLCELENHWEVLLY